MSEAFGFRKDNGRGGEWCDLEFAGSEGLKNRPLVQGSPPHGTPMRIEYHRTLLADRVRNDAFYAALRSVIVPGKTTVADIGAGTGFLGFLAAKLGAARVDLYETGDIAELARRLLRHGPSSVRWGLWRGPCRRLLAFARAMD